MNLKRASSLTLVPWVYRLWQAPFAAKKMAPVVRHNQLAQSRRVLDVGCGPGTNAPFFPGAEYLGIDLEDQYVAAARRRHEGRFLVADARTLQLEDEEPFDLILVNSLLHHLETGDVRAVLRRVESLLAADGRVHVIDLLLPAEKGIPRWLAVSDRGDFPRRHEEWKNLFTEIFDLEIFEPFYVSSFGIKLWELVYFRGSRRSSLGSRSRI